MTFDEKMEGVKDVAGWGSRSGSDVLQDGRVCVGVVGAGEAARSFSNASVAALASASILVLPLPLPSSSSPHIAAQIKPLSCAGPLDESSLYVGAGREDC